MPISLIPVVLSISFVLVWFFIGAMVLRNGQFALRGESDRDSARGSAHRRPQSAKVRRIARTRVVPPRHRSSAA